jgi:uncharacterized membrane protein YphA (DoxX/SURF4 family)
MENYILIIQILLAVFFIMPGIMKVKTSKEVLVARGNMQPDGSIGFIRFLGTAELLGVLAMIVPIFMEELHVMTAMAAIGFAVVMIGALVIHLKKKEFIKLPILVIALVASVLVLTFNM